MAPFALGILLVSGVSFLDDLFHLSVKPRFLVQCLAALLVVLSIRPQQLDLGIFTLSDPFILIPFIFLLTLWAINHFNFMDGLDGFCASQAVFLFAAYAILFAMSGDVLYQQFCLVLISCLLGFLAFNFPPAKLFMGDIGSATLGFISLALALIAQQKWGIPILYWFMLNGLFLFDSTCTLIRRMIKKEKWSAPHRKHAYQRLRQSGVPVSIILLGQLLINMCFFILVLLFNARICNSFFIILLQLGLVFTIYGLIEKIFPMFKTDFTY